MNLLLDHRYPSAPPCSPPLARHTGVEHPRHAVPASRGKWARAPADAELSNDHGRAPGNPLIVRLKQLSYLSSEDQDSVLNALDAPRKALPKSSLERSQEHSSSVRFIQQGFAYRYIGLPDGRRQITNLLLPGDPCDSLASAVLHTEHGICALTAVTYTEMKRPALVALVDNNPRIAAALWRSFLLTEAMLHERIVSLGQRSAKERLAHFLCEVFYRCRAIGLTSGMQCSLPLSQGDLGDTLGLSLVHTNRSLMALRADGLIRLETRLLTILDLPRLQETAHFSPRYLQLEPDALTPARPGHGPLNNVASLNHAHRNARV